MAKDYIGIGMGNGLALMYQGGTKARALISRMPENLIKDSEIVSPEMLAKFLKEMKKEGGFRGRDCAFILPEFSTYFRTLQMPVVSEKQLKLNLPYEFRDFVENESINYNYDYAVDSYEKDEDGNITALNLFSAAAAKPVITEYERILSRAGLRMKLALPREMALLSLMRHAIAKGENPDKTYVIIDIGFSSTRVYIFEGSKLAAAKKIEAGGREIDNAIAEYYGIDVYLAASYRESNHEDILSSDVCDRVYNGISLEVMKAINFYRYENQQSEFTQCYICGVCSDTEEFVEKLLEYIQLDRADLSEILPKEASALSDIARAVVAVGVTL